MSKYKIHLYFHSVELMSSFTKRKKKTNVILHENVM